MNECVIFVENKSMKKLPLILITLASLCLSGQTARAVDFVLLDMETTFRLGVWQPMGSLSAHAGMGFSGTLGMGFSVNEKDYFDLLIGCAVPSKGNGFTYDGQLTKANALANLSLSYRYKSRINMDMWWNRYVGAGVNILYTDLTYSEEEEYYDEYYDEYYYETKTYNHSVVAPVVHAGIDLQYKAVGVFLELHYAFYNLSNKVTHNLGGQTITSGVRVSF